MRGVVIHAPRDLRVHEVPEQDCGPRDVLVRVERGGICGSDLHYFNHGGTSTIRLREPMILGHEVAGTVVAIGEDVTRVAVGARVAVNPSRACGRCAMCLKGLQNHCEDMRFLGSAMRFPHIQGGFRETLLADERQAVPIADEVGMGEAAMAEPLAVCLHAVERAGLIAGRRVLVTGCGPIGALLIVAARLAGAREVVATDVQPFALNLALRMGADAAVDVSAGAEALAAMTAETGPFDVMFEASGSPAALRAGIERLHPRGRAVQVGLGGEIPLPINIVVTREIDLVGTFRFGPEFELAVDLINRRRVDVAPLLSATVPFTEALEAFDMANDRNRHAKVQLSFD